LLENKKATPIISEEKGVCPQQLHRSDSSIVIMRMDRGIPFASGAMPR
jgi:hypothetical protein